jgi:hypothetical protein
MSATRSGPDERDAGSWASESLPLSVRKELLERELKKLGFRKAAAQGMPQGHQGHASQQQADTGASHPQADSEGGEQHAQ